MAFANGVVIFPWRPLKTGKLKKGIRLLWLSSLLAVAARGSRFGWSK